jgi:hypothetical protein
VKAIVWPELFKRPKVKITSRERAAAKNRFAPKNEIPFAGLAQNGRFLAVPL